MQSKISAQRRDIKNEERKLAAAAGTSGNGSPGANEKRRSPARGSSRSGQDGGEDTESLVSSLNHRVSTLESDLRRRQENYLRREQQDKDRIRALEDSLQSATAERKSWMSQDKLNQVNQ